MLDVTKSLFWQGNFSISIGEPQVAVKYKQSNEEQLRVSYVLYSLRVSKLP